MRYGWVWNEKTATGNFKATWTRDYVKWVRNPPTLAGSVKRSAETMHPDR